MLEKIDLMPLLAIIVYVSLKQNPYRTLRKKELVFDEEVYKELRDEFLKMRKILAGGIGVGLVMFGGCNCGWELPWMEEISYREEVFYMLFSMILTGAASFILFFCIGIYWCYTVLLRNREIPDFTQGGDAL